MRVTLDLKKLLHEGQITQAEFDKLSRLGRSGTGELGINVLIGFGVISVAGSALLLLPNALTGIVLGLAIMAAGVAVLVSAPRWLVLGNVCLLVAALLFGGGLIALRGPMADSFLMMAAIFATGAVAARSGLLTALTVLALAAALGGAGDYSHARYTLVVRQPALTVVLFSLLGLALHWFSGRLVPAYERLAVIVARTCVFLVNLGFWVGSLWGDDLGWLSSSGARDSGASYDPAHLAEGPAIPALAFAILWVAALLGAGVWAARVNRRWLLNLAAAFGGIHFYTQWFERLGATPASILCAGLLLLVVALVLWRWRERGVPAGASTATPRGT